MGFYSFVVVAPDEIALPPHYMVFIGPGRNVFNAVMNDVDEFTAILKEQGANVLQINRLDVHEPPPVQIERDPFDDDPPSFSIPR